MIYLGGAVDYAAGLGHDWRHDAMWDGLSVYCPVCGHGVPEDDPDRVDKILAINKWRLLYSCNKAVIRLDEGVLSVGTPIEAWWKCEQYAPGVVFVHPKPPGLFVKHMVAKGAHIVPDLEVAIFLLRGHDG